MCVSNRSADGRSELRRSIVVGAPSARIWWSARQGLLGRDTVGTMEALPPRLHRGRSGGVEAGPRGHWGAVWFTIACCEPVTFIYIRALTWHGVTRSLPACPPCFLHHRHALIHFTVDQGSRRKRKRKRSPWAPLTCQSTCKRLCRRQNAQASKKHQ